MTDHPTPPAAASDFVSIPRASLKWWRELVDINPADLAPRIDAYLTAPPIAQQGGVVTEALRLVMQYPDIRKYLGQQISDIADAALASKADGEKE